METQEQDPQPSGTLTLSTPALPKDTNGYGHIHAGWIVSQMNFASCTAGEKITRCRVVTVSISSMNFVSPVALGSQIEIYTEVKQIGRSSIQVGVEVWAHKYNETRSHKVTEATFVVVAVNDQGHAQTINQH